MGCSWIADRTQSVMPSKSVIDRERSSRQVSSMLRQHAPQVTEQLGARFEPVMDKKKKESKLDVELFLELLARSLERVTQELVEADAAHEAELSDDATPREERDRHFAAGYDLVATIRAT